jgi:hypothetical protein
MGIRDRKSKGSEERGGRGARGAFAGATMGEGPRSSGAGQGAVIRGSDGTVFGRTRGTGDESAPKRKRGK